MKDHLVKLGSGLLFLGVGSVLGAVIQSRRDQSAAETRFLDYDVTVNNDLLRTPEVSGRRLRVTLDDEPLEELSEVRVAIYNYSDRHYKDLSIYIDIAALEGSSIELLQADVVGHDGLMEAVSPLREPIFDVPSDSIVVAYQLSTVNRTEGPSFLADPEFQARFLMSGRANRFPLVRLSEPGVDLRPLGSSPSAGISDNIFFAIFFFGVAAYIGAMWLGFRHTKKVVVRDDQQLLNKICELQESSDDALTAEAVMRLIKTNRWERIPRIFRWTAPYLKPD